MNISKNVVPTPPVLESPGVFFFIKYRIPGLNLFSPENELFDGAEYFKVHQVMPSPKKEKIDDNTFPINIRNCKKIGKIQRNAADAPQSNDCF